ncbi:MAG TPA: toll/interleukin-1 receptor domain-containing protein [Pyrinomonadaceae bacterium]
MSYLPSFDYDLFISYAHVDNQPGGRRGWVHRFQEELVLRLDRRLGRIGAAKIWWDSQLDGSQVFGQKIRNTINRSALFLALTSEGYLRSDYCRDELNWFCEKAEAEPPTLIVGDRARVFNVLLDNIPHTRWPARYGGTNGYPFYDEEVGLPLETRRKPFDLQLNRMVKVICELLEAMRGAPEEEEEEEPFTVFIADTATTLRNVRSRLCNELQGKGVRIAERVPPPHPLREHEEAVAEKVKSADLCVHLLDAVPGTEIIDEPSRSYLETQAELSLAHARWQFVWVPSDLTAERIEVVEDEAHRNLLRRLEAGPAAAARDAGGYKFVRDLPSNISNNILERIEQIRKERAAAQPAAAGEPLAALVATHFKDQQYVMALSSFLLQQQVIPLINREEDSPKKNLEYFESQLRKASLFIVVFGGVPPEWVRERLGEALKVAVTMQHCALRACGVYLAPPRKNAADVQFNRTLFPLEILDNTERFDPRTLAPLLAKLQAGA